MINQDSNTEVLFYEAEQKDMDEIVERIRGLMKQYYKSPQQV